MALTVRVPVVENVIEHPPADTGAAHISPLLALTVTVPVGGEPPNTPLTLTLIITGL
jgi:hypothetical protein